MCPILKIILDPPPYLFIGLFDLDLKRSFLLEEELGCFLWFLQSVGVSQHW